MNYLSIFRYFIAFSIAFLCGIGTITYCYVEGDYSWNWSLGLGLYMGAVSIAYIIQLGIESDKHENHEELSSTTRMARGEPPSRVETPHGK